jgi:hypothetical protein
MKSGLTKDPIVQQTKILLSIIISAVLTIIFHHKNYHCQEMTGSWSSVSLRPSLPAWAVLQQDQAPSRYLKR